MVPGREIEMPEIGEQHAKEQRINPYVGAEKKQSHAAQWEDMIAHNARDQAKRGHQEEKQWD